MLWGNLEGRGVWWRLATCICMAESHFFRTVPPEAITTLLISYTPTQNKKFNLKKRFRFKERTDITVYTNYTDIIWDFGNQENTMPWLGCGRSQWLATSLKKKKNKQTNFQESIIKLLHYKLLLKETRS